MTHPDQQLDHVLNEVLGALPQKNLHCACCATPFHLDHHQDKVLVAQYLRMLLTELQSNKHEDNHWSKLYGTKSESAQLGVLIRKALMEPFHSKKQHFYCPLCYRAGYDDHQRYQQDQSRAVMEARLSPEFRLYTTLRPNGSFQSPRLYLGARLARFMQLAGSRPETHVSDKERLKVLRHTVRRIGHHSVPVSRSWDDVWTCNFFRRGQQIYPDPLYANEARTDIGRIFRRVKLEPLPNFDPCTFEPSLTLNEKIDKLDRESEKLEERLQEIRQKKRRLELQSETPPRKKSRSQ